MLPEISYLDVGEQGVVELCRRERQRGLQLIHDTRLSFGHLSNIPAPAVLRLGDRLAKRWLERTGDPYLKDIEAMANILGVPGIYALNLSYEWGCTSGVYATAQGPTLLRVLDFVYNGLGRHIVAARQHAPAGTFVSLTWPGTSGIIQATAEGRFAAALNLAPMRRHGLMLAGDWAKNRFLMLRNSGLPPAHLLRKVFEEAPDYAAAKAWLTETPVCVPCIFILAGTKDGEGVIIERLETSAHLHELGKGERVTIANDFLGHFQRHPQGWRPREIDCAGRQKQSQTHPLDPLNHSDFAWLEYPMRNEMTRLIMKASPAAGSVLAQGYEAGEPATALLSSNLH